MEKIKLASITMTSRSDKEANVSHALALIAEAAAEGANWILLPELFSFHGPYEKLPQVSESEGGPLNQALAAAAREHKVTLFAGSVPEIPTEEVRTGKMGLPYNTLYAFSPAGEVFAKYRKIHLFNLAGENGSAAYNESNGYRSGDQIVTTEVDGWKVGFAICYDIRFPGLFLHMQRHNPVDILVIPSAFTRRTGQTHWQLLLQARAVESQCYILSSNQVGEHAPGKESYGHSLIIDPWGAILADSGESSEIIFAHAEKPLIKRIRSNLPALQNRRDDIY